MSIKICYQDLVKKTEEHDGKKYLMHNNNTLNNVLDKIKEIIGLKKFDDVEMLIDIDDKICSYSLYNSTNV